MGGDGAGDGAEDAGHAVEGMDPAGVLEVGVRGLADAVWLLGGTE